MICCVGCPAGYSREDLAKIWSGNVLRVLRAAEGYAQQPTAAH